MTPEWRVVKTDKESLQLILYSGHEALSSVFLYKAPVG